MPDSQFLNSGREIFNPNLKKTGLKGGKEKLERWETKGKEIPKLAFTLEINERGNY